MAIMNRVFNKAAEIATKNFTRRLAQDRAIREYIENQRMAAADPRIFQ